uniref:Uncharacterized protein n=1 Tax=Oryza nivara TaxID=4536 RepID=A0A0E0J7V6_ORYNI
MRVAGGERAGDASNLPGRRLSGSRGGSGTSRERRAQITITNLSLLGLLLVVGMLVDRILELLNCIPQAPQRLVQQNPKS